jgi:hypothetical protein
MSIRLWRSIPEGARILQGILTVLPLLGHHLLTLRFDPPRSSTHVPYLAASKARLPTL